MDAKEAKRLERNERRRLAYVSMDACERDSCQSKRRDRRRDRHELSCSSSVASDLPKIEGKHSLKIYVFFLILSYL